MKPGFTILILSSVAGKTAVSVSSDKTGGFACDILISTFTKFDADQDHSAGCAFDFIQSFTRGAGLLAVSIW
jgi:hypothetical protein